MSAAQKIILVLFFVWMILQHAIIWPDYISYFNLASKEYEKRPEKILIGPNLDWGQDLPALARWMEKNQVQALDLAYYGHDDPARFDINYSLPGRGSENSLIAVSANILMGMRYPMTFSEEGVDYEDPLWSEVARYRDLRPAAKIGNSIFVFEKLPEE